MRTVKAAPLALAALALLMALVATGCFARRYPGLMEKHLEVLGLYADKLQALAQDEHAVPAQDWGEFTYPLERAREFARVAESRYPDRASLKAFVAALEAYGALVADPAALSAPGAAASVGAKAAAFRSAAAAARAALDRER
ncbi:MAG: hypothetical protein U0842_01710 [Candidatus Binatia bacterium]